MNPHFLYAKTPSLASEAPLLWSRMMTLSKIVVAIVAYISLLPTCGAKELLSDKIARWDFQRAEDKNLDGRPDGWKRVLDRDHPDYIDLKIQPRDEKAGLAAKRAQATMAKMMHRISTGDFTSNYVAEVLPPELAEFMDRFVLHMCLTAEMDGGSAERVSPLFPVDARFSYRLRGDIKSQNLHGHQAWVELQLLDQELEVVEILRTNSANGDTAWTRFDTKDASQPSSELKWGRIHVKIEPVPRALHFVGSASFDTIEVYRLPRLSLTTDLPMHIALPGQDFELLCTGMGLRHNGADVKFSLFDCEDQLLDHKSVMLDSMHTEPTRPSGDNENGSQPPSGLLVNKAEKVYDGTAAWNLKLDLPGLYRVRAELDGRDKGARQREILIAVMSPQENFASGPFSWAIKEFTPVLQPEDLPALVRRFGASHIKFPVWFDEGDTDTAIRLSKLIDKLQAVGTKSIGRLDTPPDSFGIDDEDQLTTLAMLRNPKNWEQMIAPVLTRLGMKLTWYQLGEDDDLSLMSHEDVTELLRKTRLRMQTYSQELKLVLAWDWLTPEPPNPQSSWNATHYRESPALPTDELEQNLIDESRTNEMWVNFNPLPKSQYTLLERVRDLVERAIVIKKSEAKAAFLSDPFDTEQGIFEPDGTVGEMLLPWQTVVSAIGAGIYEGSVQLPGESVNHVFQTSGESVMLLWNDIPTTEQLYLGDDVSAIDIWGREVPVERLQNMESGASEQSIRVNQWPTIVRGVDIRVVRWRQEFELKVTHLASTLGVVQNLPLVVENSFDSLATGTVTLHSPSLIGKKRTETRFEFASQGKHDQQIPTAVRSDASAGEHPLRFDFDFMVDKPYKFSVYRSIKLGIGDVEFIWNAERIGTDRVELRLELLNHTQKNVNFDCKIFPTGRAYERMNVLDAAPGSTLKQQNIKAPTNEDGQIWIRCEQIGTGRILNYRVNP